MEPLLKKFLHYISIENTKQLFNCIKPDFSNIDEVYINNLNVWYCNISDIKPTTKDGKGIEITNGILLNPENVIISKTKEGFELTEIDFINSELKSFEFLEFDKLNLIEQKQFEYYKDYLNKKKIHTEWTLNDYYNRYIETKQFFNFFNRIYKRHEYTEIKDRLNTSAERFNYILNKLQPEDKQEFISYYKSDLTNLRNKQTQIEFIDLINGFIQAINKPPQQVDSVKPDEVKNIHPKFNPNYWNKECFELFKYIYDEYYKGTKRQLTNIWFYLKECQNTNYILKATKEQYETFILENYQIKITNFDKAQTKWEDKEYGTINDHRINFEDSLK